MILLATLWHSVITFLIIVCWQPDSMCRALSVLEHSGQKRLVERLLLAACCCWLNRVPVQYHITLRCSKCLQVPKGICELFILLIMLNQCV